VAAALANPQAEGLQPGNRYRAPEPGCQDWIGAAPGERIARLDVYAEAYFQRIVEALQADFPALARALGRRGFPKLVADYLKVRPTRSFTLSEGGRHLPGFVAENPPAVEARWLADLARLEWALVLAFHADDVPPITAADLRAVPEEVWPDARFMFDPALQLLALDWPVDALWLTHEGDGFPEAVAALAPIRTDLLVTRRVGTAVVERIDPTAAALLRALQQGDSLESVCTRAQQLLPGRPEADLTAQVMAWFGGWIAAGLICRAVLPHEAAPASRTATFPKEI
jgi:hypothetical protein